MIAGEKGNQCDGGMQSAEALHGRYQRKTGRDDEISDFIAKSEKEVVLMIDEVDKSSNSQLFL